MKRPGKSSQATSLTDFFSQVSRFILFFGGFWVLFTGAMMIGLEGKTYLVNPGYGISSLLSLLYVGKVFWEFYRDVKRKTTDPKFQFVTSWKNFFLDMIVLIILTVFQFHSAFGSVGFTASQFNSISNVFLALVFHFFRFVYQMISSEA